MDVNPKQFEKTETIPTAQTTEDTENAEAGNNKASRSRASEHLRGAGGGRYGKTREAATTAQPRAAVPHDSGGAGQ